MAIAQYYLYNSVIQMPAMCPGCVKTICEKPKWKLAASLWLLPHVEWVIKVNFSPVIDQLWEKAFHQRQFLGFLHSLCPKTSLTLHHR